MAEALDIVVAERREDKRFLLDTLGILKLSGYASAIREVTEPEKRWASVIRPAGIHFEGDINLAFYRGMSLQTGPRIGDVTLFARSESVLKEFLRQSGFHMAMTTPCESRRVVEVTMMSVPSDVRATCLRRGHRVGWALVRAKVS